MLTSLAFALSVLFLCLLIVLIGVQGVSRTARRRMAELESDIISLDERFTREQKRRAGVSTQEQRQMNMEEAKVIAASNRSKPPVIRLPGRSAFNE